MDACEKKGSSTSPTEQGTSWCWALDAGQSHCRLISGWVGYQCAHGPLCSIQAALFSSITAHSSPVHSALPPQSFMLCLLLSFTHLCLSSETASSVGSSLVSFTALEPAPLLICDAHFSLLFKVSSQAYNVIRLCSYNLFLLHKLILEPWDTINTRAMGDHRH